MVESSSNLMKKKASGVLFSRTLNYRILTLINRLTSTIKYQPFRPKNLPSRKASKKRSAHQIFSLLLQHTDQSWRTQHQPIAEDLEEVLVVVEEAEDAAVVDVEVEDVVEARKKKNGFLLLNWEDWLKMEKSSPFKRSTCSLFPLKNLKSSTSSLDLH